MFVLGTLNGLRDEARNNLRLTASVIQTQGNDLDVGEHFTVRFTLFNDFRGSNGETPGHAHFRNLSLKLSRTTYARPVAGDEVTLNLTDHLGFGSGISRDVEFEALAKIPLVRLMGHLWDIPEPYVKARAEADFDILRFFHIVQDEVFTTQIEEG